MSEKVYEMSKSLQKSQDRPTNATLKQEVVNLRVDTRSGKIPRRYQNNNQNEHNKAYFSKTIVYILLRLAGTAQNNKVNTQGLKHTFCNEHNEFQRMLWKGGME